MTDSKRWAASSSVSRSYPGNEDNRFFKNPQNVCREMCFAHSDTEPGASSLIARFWFKFHDRERDEINRSPIGIAQNNRMTHIQTVGI